MQFRSILIGCAIAGIGLVMTNPSEEAYGNFVVRTWQKQVCQQRSLPIYEVIACEASRILPSKVRAGIVRSYSSRQSYLFFTVYDLNLGKSQHRIIGIGGHFFTT